MNRLRSFFGSTLLVLAAALAGLAAAPGASRAGDHCYCPPKPCYNPPCCQPHCYQPPCYQPCYHYEYHNDYVKVPYTCYDECGRPYTAYKVETVQTKVRVAD